MTELMNLQEVATKWNLSKTGTAEEQDLLLKLYRVENGIEVTVFSEHPLEEYGNRTVAPQDYAETLVLASRRLKDFAPRHSRLSYDVLS
jgi:hypothetical protein